MSVKEYHMYTKLTNLCHYIGRILLCRLYNTEKVCINSTYIFTHISSNATENFIFLIYSHKTNERKNSGVGLLELE